MKHNSRNGQIANMQDYDLFVGLDVDKSSFAVTVRDREGLGRSVKMPSDANMLLSFVANEHPDARVLFAYEAGPTGFGLYDAITGAGHGCLVVSPSSIPDAPNRRVKTNRLDSKKLAQLLRGDQLRGVRVPNRSIRELRSLVQLRYTYMQEIRAYKCRIKAELLKDGLEFPKAPQGSQWSRRVIDSLRLLECPVAIGYKINSMLEHIDFTTSQMRMVEMSIKSHIRGNSDLSACIDYLMSCPGIGWRIACYVLSRMGEWRSLGASKEAGAFFGLVPSEDSTGDSTNRGHITKCGDPKLRSMLIQGAWVAIRRDAQLKEFYDRVYRSHSRDIASRVAIVAVARKLAERMHCVLREQRRYGVRAAA
jgi:transposase